MKYEDLPPEVRARRTKKPLGRCVARVLATTEKRVRTCASRATSVVGDRALCPRHGEIARRRAGLPASRRTDQ